MSFVVAMAYTCDASIYAPINSTMRSIKPYPKDTNKYQYTKDDSPLVIGKFLLGYLGLVLVACLLAYAVFVPLGKLMFP
jgi:hypothetical protein